jgi:hypothetical protein
VRSGSLMQVRRGVFSSVPAGSGKAGGARLRCGSVLWSGKAGGAGSVRFGMVGLGR